MNSRFDDVSQKVIVELSVAEAYDRGYSCLPEYVRLQEKERRDFANMNPDERRIWLLSRNRFNLFAQPSLEDDEKGLLG